VLRGQTPQARLAPRLDRNGIQTSGLPEYSDPRFASGAPRLESRSSVAPATFFALPVARSEPAAAGGHNTVAPHTFKMSFLRVVHNRLHDAASGIFCVR
jgi:hypothetical protein